MQFYAGDWCVTPSVVVASLSCCVRATPRVEDVLFQRTPKADHQAPTLVGWECLCNSALRWSVRYGATKRHNDSGLLHCGKKMKPFRNAFSCSISLPYRVIVWGLSQHDTPRSMIKSVRSQLGPVDLRWGDPNELASWRIQGMPHA